MAAIVSRLHVEEAAAFVRRLAPLPPEVALILGSGLGQMADQMAGATIIPFSEIPHFPPSTVDGHAGKLVVGELGGRVTAVFQGRLHYYEGYSMGEVVFPVRLAWTLGARVLVATNAAGGLNPEFRAGDLMLIRDHLNLMGSNPLIGPNEPAWGPRFPGMADAYSPRLLELARRQAMPLREGIYAALSGPSYESLAEIRFLRMIGADAVGMSTVPEVIAARQMGMEVLGISCITNVLSLDRAVPVDHEEVIETGRRVAALFRALMLDILRAL